MVTRASEVAANAPSKAAADKGRVRWVDAYKGILILLVVAGHAVVGVMADSTFAHSAQIPSLMYVRKLIYSFHMPAFFVAAGLFAGGLWCKDLGKQMLSKVDRLVRPYFLWGFALACAMQLMSGYTNKGLGFSDFLISYRVPFSQYWFLYVLFVVFCIHLLLSVLVRRWADYALLALGVVLYFAVPVLPDVWVLIYVGKYLLFYAGGMFVYSLLAKWANAGRAGWFGVTAVACAFALVGVFSLGDWAQTQGYAAINVWTLGLSVLGAAMVYATALFACDALPMLAERLGGLGKESMALYVMHPFFVQGTRIALVRFLNVENPWFVVAVATVVGTVVCWAAVRLLVGKRAYRWLF